MTAAFPPFNDDYLDLLEDELDLYYEAQALEAERLEMEAQRRRQLQQQYFHQQLLQLRPAERESESTTHPPSSEHSRKPAQPGMDEASGVGAAGVPESDPDHPSEVRVLDPADDPRLDTLRERERLLLEARYRMEQQLEQDELLRVHQRLVDAQLFLRRKRRELQQAQDQRERPGQPRSYTYLAPWSLYAVAWSNRRDFPPRLAIGSFIEEYRDW